jgi:AraC-like DNA-binding protein
LSTDKTVTQIAILVGFEDPAYFTRSFKRIEGMSPRAYRDHYSRAAPLLYPLKR